MSLLSKMSTARKRLILATPAMPRGGTVYTPKSCGCSIGLEQLTYALEPECEVRVFAGAILNLQENEMKRKLIKPIVACYYYYEEGKKIESVPPGIRGNLTDISGDLSGIFGDITGIFGDLTDCELTEEDRKKGVNIKDLIKLTGE